MGQVYVIGSINLDLVAFAERLPTRGETVGGQAFARLPGGKGANQAVAAARAGAETVMVGALGDDLEGRFLRGALAEAGLVLDQVETVTTPSGVALIVVGGGDNQIVAIPGANAAIDPARLAALPLQPGDLCLTQMETRPEVVAAALRRARACGARALFNPAPALPAAAELFALADLLILNETEVRAFSGRPFDTAALPASLAAAAAGLGLRPEQTLVVTLGAAGACALSDGRVVTAPGRPVPVVDTTGAGDCFCGYLAAGLAGGAPLDRALARANGAAALAVQRRGAIAALPFAHELDALPA